MARVKRLTYTEETFKVLGKIPIETNEKLDYWAPQLGMTKTALVGVCVRVGLTQVIRIVAPEKLLSEPDLAKVVALTVEKLGSEHLGDVFNED